MKKYEYYVDFWQDDGQTIAESISFDTPEECEKWAENNLALTNINVAIMKRDKDPDFDTPIVLVKKLCGRCAL